TLIAVAAATPYIALQLKALAGSFEVIRSTAPDAVQGTPSGPPNFQLAFWIAAGMALFTILFGTRTLDADERHHGVVAAIAVEAVVKLAALVTVGLLVVFGLAGGPAGIFAHMPPGMLQAQDVFDAR